MRRFLLGAAIPFLGLGQSFLIPPEIIAVPAEIFERLTGSVGFIAPINKQAIRIECSGCPVGANPTGKTGAPQNSESLLELNLTIQQNNIDQLLLNDVPIYPVNDPIHFSPNPLSAPQLAQNEMNEWEYISTVALAVSTRVQQFAKDMSQNNFDLIKIDIDILQVGDAVLNSIPTVELELLKTATGKLEIRKTEIRKPNPLTPTVLKFDDCSTLLCRWRVMLSEALKKAKGVTKPCSSHHISAFQPLKSHRPQQAHPDIPTTSKETSRPFPHSLSLKNILGSILYHTLSLVLFGVLLSVSACLLGWTVGHVLIFMWSRIFRHDSDEYMSVPQSDLDEKSDIFKGERQT